MLHKLPAGAHAACWCARCLLVRTLPAGAHAPLRRTRCLLVHTLFFVAHALLRRTRSSSSHTLLFVAHALLRCTRSSSSHTLPAGAHAPLRRTRSSSLHTLFFVAHAACWCTRSSSSHTLPAGAHAPLRRTRSSSSHTLLFVAHAAMSPPLADMSIAPQSRFTFESGQKFLQFYDPNQPHETLEKPDDSAETRRLLRNRAQCQLLMRLSGLVSQRRRFKLDTNFEHNWNKILDSEPKGGYDLWWEKLKERTHLSVVEKDAICLGNAFENKKMAWRFTQYPSVENFVSTPYCYRQLLAFVIKSDSAIDRDAQHPVEQGHTSVNKTKEDQLGGATQSLGPQSTCEGPTNERGNVVSDVKRPNDEDSHERKRMCLGLERPNTHSTQDAMSVAILDQEPYTSSNLERNVRAETPAHIGRRSTIHSLMLAPTIEDVSPNFEYLGQIGSAESMQNESSALDRHTSTDKYNVYHVQEDSLTQTPGILDDSSPWLDPNYTHDKSNRESSDLASIGVEKLDGTGDSIVTYRWEGIEALKCIGKDVPSVNDGKWCYINMALCDLPFKALAETIKQSDMWNRENLEISTNTSCLTLRLRRRVIDRYCDLDCIVPTAMVPQIQGIQRRDNHAQ